MENSNSELAFRNFLMTRKLDELLKLAVNEDNQEKLIYIKRAIHMKANYLTDDNKTLSGVAQCRHRKNIEKRYKGSEYEKLIEIKKKSHFYEWFWTTVLTIVVFIMGVIYRENVINKNQITDSYTYNGKVLTKSDMEKVLKAKVKLGELYEKKEDIKTSYLRYSEAKEVSKILKAEEELRKVTEKVLSLERKLYEKLDLKIEVLQKYLEKSEKEFIEKTFEALTLAKLLQNLEKQGTIYELKGDYFFKKGELDKSRNNYWIASKMLDNKNRVISKLDIVEGKITEILAEKEEQIKKLKNRERKI